MSDDLVKRAREVLNGVTPGPWHTSPDGWRVTDKRVTFDDDGARCGETPNICIFAETEANAHFIAASRELVPAMADRIEELEAERDELRSAIFGREDYASDLRNGNFSEMARTLHAAQKGGLTSAETAEAKLKTSEEIGRAFEEDAGQLRAKLALIKEYAIAGASNGFENCGMCENILDTLAEISGGGDT